MKITISTTIDVEVHKLAQDNKVAWNDALEFGVKFLVAQKEGFDYPENKLLNKIQFLSQKIGELSIENESLKTPAPVVDQVNAEQEVEDLLKDQLGAKIDG
jgi:hypothetical protein